MRRWSRGCLAVSKGARSLPGWQPGFLRTVGFSVALAGLPGVGISQVPTAPALLDLKAEDRSLPLDEIEGTRGRFFQVGDLRYFAHDDGVHGMELWRSDGTGGGTYLFRDLCPGVCPGVAANDMAMVDGRLYFRGFEEIHGPQLYVFDGVSVELAMLLEPDRIGPSSLIGAGTSLYFQAWDPGPEWLDGQWRLWRYDTAAGTAQEGADTPAGTELYGGLGDELLLVMDARLWITAAGGTELVPLTPDGVEIVPGEENRAFAGDRFYFEASDTTNGQEPWVTDGTVEGTSPLGDLTPGAGSSTVHEIRSFGPGVILRASTPATGSELWTSAGIPGDPTLLGEIVSGTGDGAEYLLGSVAGSLLFYGYDASHGWEPWLTDGTIGGAGFLADVYPGTAGSLSSDVSRGHGGDGSLYLFLANDGTHGPEPWITDGTPGGTELLVDLYVDDEFDRLNIWSSDPSWRDGVLLYMGYSGDDVGAGWEPWVSDGTSSGTTLLGDFSAQSHSVPLCNSTPCPLFAPTPSGTFFTARSDPSSWWPRLLLSEGASSSTRDLEEFWLSWYQVTAWSRHGVVFGSEMLASDGTVAGTIHLENSDGERARNDGWTLPAIGGTVFFTQDDELWGTDGSSSGTKRVLGPSTGDFAGLAHDGHLYAPSPGELWKVGPDWTSERFADLPGSSSLPYPFGAVSTTTGERVLFRWNDGVHGWEPWVSDGTSEGTFLLADLMPGAEGSIVQYWWYSYDDPGDDLREVSGPKLVAFLAADAGGNTLYVSDGTSAGTVPVVEETLGVRPEDPRWVVPFRDGFAFRAWTPEQGLELWIHDGLGAEARLLDLVPGPESSVPRFLTQVGDGLAFSAWDAANGVELWTSDGTLEGTGLAFDLNPGPPPSSPLSLVSGHGKLWFAATDGVHGFEPWSAKLDRIFSDGFEAGDTLRWSLAD